MKPLFQELPFPIDSHIHFYVEDLPHFIVPWHYHPAIEIMYITSGTGTRFVGDHVEGYFEGDVCMICLLYTSDAADEEDSVDLGGRRIIKKKIFSSIRRQTR